MNYDNLFRLDGRRAVVLGGGSGIGREAARALSAHGADVVVADRDIAAARETGVGEAYEIDLLKPGAVDRAASDLGPLDVVVLTAATNVRKRLLDYTRDEFDRVLALNLGVTFEVVRAFGADMVARGRGSIIGFSSIRGTTVEPGQGPYAATKAGLVQLFRTAAAEFGPAGCPGQRDRPRRRRDPADRADQGESGVVRRLRAEGRAGPLGASRRARRRRRLPRFGRVDVRHRFGAGGGRWLDRRRRPLRTARFVKEGS